MALAVTPFRSFPPKGPIVVKTCYRHHKPTQFLEKHSEVKRIIEPKKRMQVEVKCECSNGGCLEWAIVELQGTIEIQPTYQNQLQNLDIGCLCRSSTQDKYLFTVGYHELEGKKVPLKKPFLVLRKKELPGMMEVESLSNIPEAKCSRVELEVVGIIRHKILFKTRPKALITKPEVKERKIRTLDPVAG